MFLFLVGYCRKYCFKIVQIVIIISKKKHTSSNIRSALIKFHISIYQLKITCDNIFKVSSNFI
jgi:hypothetical protein